MPSIPTGQTKRIRRYLQVGSCGLLALSLVVVAWAYQAPVPASATLPTPTRASTTSERDPAFQSPPVDEFAAVWNRRLRKPLVDPPPKPAAPPKEKRRRKRDVLPVAPSDLVLIGTLIEEGDESLAILMDSKGELSFKRVGESLSFGGRQARLKAITAVQISLDVEGQAVALEIAKAAPAPARNRER